MLLMFALLQSVHPTKAWQTLRSLMRCKFSKLMFVENVPMLH